MVDEFGNQVKIGDEEDIGEVSEGLMARIHEAVETILNEEMPDQSVDDMFSEQGDHSRDSMGVRESDRRPSV